MKKEVKSLVFGALLAVVSPLALAGADCKEYPKDQWMSEFDLQKKIINEYGFAIAKFKVDDNCYEIYGWEKSASAKDGKQKIEVYFDAHTGEIVKKK